MGRQDDKGLTVLSLWFAGSFHCMDVSFIHAG